MSNAIEIKRGTFKLVRTIENPKPNKRQSRDWRSAAEWTAGTLYIIGDWHGGDREHPMACIRTQHRDSYEIVETDERFWLLARHLAPVEEKPSDYLARTRNSNEACAVLDWLADDGVLTVADVEKAMAGLTERWVKEDQETEARRAAKDKLTSG